MTITVVNKDRESDETNEIVELWRWIAEKMIKLTQLEKDWRGDFYAVTWMQSRFMINNIDHESRIDVFFYPSSNEIHVFRKFPSNWDSPVEWIDGRFSIDNKLLKEEIRFFGDPNKRILDLGEWNTSEVMKYTETKEMFDYLITTLKQFKENRNKEYKLDDIVLVLKKEKFFEDMELIKIYDMLKIVKVYKSPKELEINDELKIIAKLKELDQDLDYYVELVGNRIKEEIQDDLKGDSK
jgi:hypothetical protein